MTDYAYGRNMPPRLNSFFLGKFYMLHFTNPTTMEVGLVTMEIWVGTMDYVKQ
jgi:hypothetical protein